MSTWKYIVSKMWLAVRHRGVRMTRCSFHSVGKGWLVNLSLPVNRIVSSYTREDDIRLHKHLETIAIRLAWMLEPDDAIQFVSGEDATPKQFYKQWLTKDGNGVKVSDRKIIHEA